MKNILLVTLILVSSLSAIAKADTFNTVKAHAQAAAAAQQKANEAARALTFTTLQLADLINTAPKDGTECDLSAVVKDGDLLVVRGQDTKNTIPIPLSTVFAAGWEVEFSSSSVGDLYADARPNTYSLVYETNTSSAKLSVARFFITFDRSGQIVMTTGYAQTSGNNNITSITCPEYKF